MSKGGAKKYRIKNLVAIVYPVPSIISTTFPKTFLLFFPLVLPSYLFLSCLFHCLCSSTDCIGYGLPRQVLAAAEHLSWYGKPLKQRLPFRSSQRMKQPASGLLMQAVLQRVWLSCLTLLAGRSVSCCISHGSPFLLQEPFYSSQMQGGFQRF